MALVVNTNSASNNAINNLNRTTRNLSGSFARISSGLRVTKAGDDAAGLGVAENLEAVASSSRQAMRNANDGISLIQTGEGSTNEVTNILQRMRDLAVQAASDTLASTEKGYIQDEYDQLVAEIDRISSVAEFNGVNIGTGTILTVQIGAGSDSANRISITFGDLQSANLNVDGMVFTNTTGAQDAITRLDAAIDTVNSFRSDYGAVQNRLDSALVNLETYVENLESAESRIRDADFAYETAELAKFQIMQQAGVSILAQANQVNQGAVQLIG